MILSIIIPVYNTAEYLSACLNSVLACDCAGCEIILVDDGSTDGSSSLCDSLAAKHPDLVRVIHQDNQGLGGARNTGLEAACGEYLFFVDSDDTIRPNAIAILKKAIEQDHPDIVAFNSWSDDGLGSQSRLLANSLQAFKPFRATDRPDFLISLPSACFRIWKRSLFLTTGIRFPSRVWYEDLRTTPKLLASASSIVTLPYFLYNYLQRPGSIMRSDQVARNREIIDAFEDLFAWFRKEGLFDRYRRVLCRLCVDHLYLAASVRVLSVDPKHPLLGELASYLETNFPDYRSNPMIPQLPRSRLLVYRLLEKKRYRLLRLLFRLHS